MKYFVLSYSGIIDGKKLDGIIRVGERNTVDQNRSKEKVKSYLSKLYSNAKIIDAILLNIDEVDNNDYFQQADNFIPLNDE